MRFTLPGPTALKRQVTESTMVLVAGPSQARSQFLSVALEGFQVTRGAGWICRMPTYTVVSRMVSDLTGTLTVTLKVSKRAVFSRLRRITLADPEALGFTLVPPTTEATRVSRLCSTNVLLSALAGIQVIRPAGSMS